MISILVPYHNRLELLRLGLLNSLKNQTYTDFEVVVIADCGSDLSFLHNEYKFQIRTYKLEHTEGWRCPSKAINTGFEYCDGEYTVLSCPEMWISPTVLYNYKSVLEVSPNTMVYCDGVDDKGKFLELCRAGREDLYEATRIKRKLNTKLPFFLGFHSCNFCGYDEEYTGVCFDDNDFVNQMQKNNCVYRKTNGTVVHLYHPRMALDIRGMEAFKYNEKRYKEKWG